MLPANRGVALVIPFLEQKDMLFTYLGETSPVKA